MRAPTIRIRDADLTVVAEADRAVSAELRPRFNAVGAWTLEVPYAGDAAAALLEPGSGIVVDDGTRTLISGPMVKVQRAWTPAGDRLTAFGVDDLVWAARRIAHPSPADGDVTTQAYDVRTGPAETVLLGYIDANAGPSALVDRRVPGLSLATDGARGETVTGRARFGNLLELLAELALAGGDLGFRIVQPRDSSSLVAEVYVPADRTSTAIFAEELGNLAGFNFETGVPDATYLYVLGQGEGTLRAVVEGGTAPAGWGRIEDVRDRRDTDDAGELAQARDEELAKAAATGALGLDPINTDAVTYGTDYGLGDKVRVLVDGSATDEVVREVKINIGADGMRVGPGVSGPGERTVLRIFDELRELRRRTAGLERRP